VTDYLQKEPGTGQYAVLANKVRNAVESHHQQERAQATRDRLRQIVDLLPQLVFAKDETGEFLLANEATADAYGTTVSDLEGATDADFADSEEEVEQFRADDQAVIESGEPKHIPEEWLTTAGGDTRLLETTKIPYDQVETDGDAVLGISTDITERKERENMLQQYQYAYESALSAIAIVDLDGELTNVNPTFLDMWGYDDEDDVIGRLAIDMWKDHEQARSVLEAIKKRGRWEGELEAVRADGSTFYARGVNSYLTDSDGNPIGVVSSFFDITERKEREAELEMQSAAMEASMDGISILNEGGEYIYMNQAHANVFAYDANELLGSTWRRLYGDDEITRIEQEVFPVLEREGKWRGETVGKRRDGSLVYQEITLSLLDDGKLICTNRDITERKEREQELEQTNTVLRTIVENLPMAVLVEDAERDVLIANDQLGETLGIPIDSEELIGRDCATAAEELKNLFTDSEEFIWGITERLERKEPVQNEELPLIDGRVIERDYVPYTLPEGEAHLWLYHDVTERKQRRQELERSNQFLQDTQENARVGGWEFDLRTESLRWTDEVYRIHGVDADFEPTVEDAIELYHPEDQTTIQDAVERVTTEGEPYDLELRIVTADDVVRWVNARGEPRHEDGGIVGVRGTFQDITERIEREQELHEEQAFIERSLNTLEDIFYFVDPDGDFQRWNSKLPALTGYSDEEIGSMNALEFFDGEHREAISHSSQEILETGSHVTEAEITTADGRQVPHEFRGVRMTNDDGEPTGIIGIARDSTERREHERRLEQQTEELEQLAIKYESQYRTLFEEAPVMTVLTRSRDSQPIIEDCNSQFVETLRYDVDTIIGRELAEFYTPESTERL
jgi:PAS domain S-box-containing protein